ncbi:TolC family protein [uncultured Desulfovibrio sp.]|uniref:TolC family protein n=1 Tax=uncultured Desulfovibrio sp. TaxID=167968 RepID=UPI00261EBE91|nr:TolC family protein [uncultured Desulfovibrio sp.]
MLRHHRSLQGMQENRQVLEHELRRARAGFGPSVDVQGEAGGSLLSDNSTRDRDLDKQMYGVGEISARLTQPIWDGFATRSRVRNAKSTLESVRARVFDTATTLSLDGIIAHIDLLRRRAIYDLAERNVGQHRVILGQTQDRTSLGVDTEADVNQAQSRLARALSSLSEARAALLVAEETYARLTGMPPAARMQPVAMPPEIFTGPRPVFELAEKHNPKLAAYLQDIRAAQADRQLAESTFYPTFNAEVGPTYTDRGGAYDRWVYSFDAVATMRWNVFNSGADVAETKAAAARIRQARQVMYDYVDDLRLDIESTWANYLAAQEQYRHYSEAIKYNMFTRTAYLEQFQLGKRSLLDVLDAENELYSSSTQAETARGNILVGAYRLCALTGNLLPMLSIDTRPLDQNPPRDPKDPREDFDLGWFN